MVLAESEKTLNWIEKAARDSQHGVVVCVDEAGGFRVTELRQNEPSSQTDTSATLPAGQGQLIDEQKGAGSLARRRFQRGSLIRRGAVWEGRWRVDLILPNGVRKRTRRRIVIGTLAEFPTKKLAQRHLDLFLCTINAPGYRPGRVATLAEFVERWKADVLTQRKPSSQKAALWHLRGFLLPFFGEMRLDQIAIENQQSFIARYAGQVERKSLLNALGTLSSILKTAHAWGYNSSTVEFSRLTLPPKSIRKRARFFTAQQARQIIAAAKEPFATIFAVAAMTALRPGEVFGLKVSDLDFQKSTLWVQRSAWYGKLQTPKSDSSVRALPLPEKLARRLQTYLLTWTPNAEELLFATSTGRPMIANNVVQRKLWPILEALKIPHCGMHAFRHTHATLLLEDAGASPMIAQAQLGHTDPRLTLSVYAHLIGEAHRKAVETVAEILDPIGPTPETNSEWVQ